MKKKKDKGLCFKYDQRQGSCHKWEGPKLFLIEEVEENWPTNIGGIIDLSKRLKFI